MVSIRVSETRRSSLSSQSSHADDEPDFEHDNANPDVDVKQVRCNRLAWGRLISIAFFRAD